MNVNIKTIWTIVYITWNVSFQNMNTNCHFYMKYQLEYRVEGSDQWLMACNNHLNTKCYFQRYYSILDKNFDYKIIAFNQHNRNEIASYNDTYTAGESN